MRYAVKNKKNIVKAYQLGAETEMEKKLVAEGAIRLRPDGRYELFSQEAKGEIGQIADAGDYFKVDVIDGKSYPYHNLRDWFEANHTHLTGDEYEQKNQPVKIWKFGDNPNTEEIRYLLSTNKLCINPDHEDNYYSAQLWGTTLTQSKDAVIIIYSSARDETGKIIDIDFGLVSRKEFEERYSICEK